MRDYLDRNYILRALRLFLLSQAAPGQTIRKLAQTAKIHRVGAGEPLFSEGDAVDRLYILLPWLDDAFTVANRA